MMASAREQAARFLRLRFQVTVSVSVSVKLCWRPIWSGTLSRSPEL